MLLYYSLYYSSTSYESSSTLPPTTYMLLFATRARPSAYVRVTLPHACRIYSYRRKTPIDHALHMIMLDNGTIGKRAVRFRRLDCQVNTDARRLEKVEK